MGYVNKFGLPREIPTAVKREVRQRCGFGCIMCGSAIYQYEHVDPVFAEATEHNPNHIVLLCGGCHDRVTRGLLSKETIKEKLLNPKCKEQGFSFGPFDLGAMEPQIILGSLRVKNVTSLIRIFGEDIFSIEVPKNQGEPFFINAFLCDREGNKILRIVKNEWQTPSNNWDVEVIGSKIVIRKHLGDVILILRSEPPHKLVVEKLDMNHKGTHIRCQEGSNIEVIMANGQIIQSSQICVENCIVGLDISENGLFIGVGGGSVYFGNTTIDNLNRYNLKNGNNKNKIGRNELCPCGSNRKYKYCCGKARDKKN